MGAVVPPDVSDSLEIHVNRIRPNVLEVPEMFVAERDFVIEIVNEGKPVHMHLNLDDDLVNVLALDTGNHFIPREDTFRLPVGVKDNQYPIRGKLTVSTGYGSESRFIEMRVVKPSEEDKVMVDDTLATPSGRTQGSPLTSRIVGEIGVIALVVVAVLALLIAGVIVGTVTTLWVGILAVVIGLLVVLGVYFFL